MFRAPLSGIVLVFIAACVSASAQVPVTMHHYDLIRSGANPNETILKTSNVNVGTFGRLFSRPVDGQIYAQPLYVPNVTIPGQGVHNVLYVATEHNSVYAFDADVASASTPLWFVNLGPSLPATVIGAIRNIMPEIGITSTPTIDLATGTLYVVAQTYESSTAIVRLHALDMKTGSEKLSGPVVISGSVPGTGNGSSGGTLAFDALSQWQRVALTLSNGRLFIGFGSHLDLGNFHGWIFGYNATTLARLSVRCFSPNANENGFWQGGLGPAIDANGFLYLNTGNGPFNVNTGGSDYGDSILKLDPSNLAILDYFSPSNQATLDTSDTDLGSSGPLLIPGTTLGASGGKDGRIFLFNVNNLGQFHGTDQVVQEWQASTKFFGGHVFYNSTLYTWGRNDALKSFAFNGATFNTTPVQGSVIVPDGYSDEPALSLSANGTAAGSSILWATFSTNGETPNGGVTPGVMYAFDASDVTRILWDSTQNGARDGLGNWAKWCPPVVANGKVYVATSGNVLQVYGLLSSGSGGSLAGTGDSNVTAVNLTTDGTADWMHWGDASLNRKAGVTPQLAYVALGGGTVTPYNNDLRILSWTDGAPIGTGSNANGLFVVGTGNGYSITAPADSTPRTLILHLGGWISSGHLAAHLSDGSAPDFLDTTAEIGSQYDRNYTLTYSAANPGQTLTVTWQLATGIGNVTLNGATLSVVAGTSSISATAGTPQSAIVGQAYGTQLQATVKDGANHPVVGTTVTFTAPSNGPSGKFGSSVSANVLTDATGVATAPAFTANTTTGSFTITAGAAGVSAPTSFSLSNTAGPPATITASSGSGQSATVGITFATALKATVKDAAGNPVSGAMVTFTAPASGPSGAFGGLLTATIATNGSGAATAPAFTANAQTGSFSVTAAVSGVASPAAFTLTNTAASATGSLSASGTSSATAASLTAEGPADWVHWGDAALNRKTGVTAQITSYTAVGGGAINTYSNDPRALSWTDGTPAATGSNNNGIYVAGVASGFSFTAPADTNTRTLIVHVGGWASAGKLTAHLSDSSAPDYVDTTTTAGGQYDRNYTLTYQAAGSGQLLTVTWLMSAGGGNVTLNGAALSGVSVTPSSIAATAGSGQSAVVNTAFATALKATVKDSSNNVLSGVTVTFTAPAGGASALFGSSNTTSALTDANGVATAALSANATAGSYAVTAGVAGLAATAAFNLTNSPDSAAGVTATAGSSQSTTINTAFGTNLQATVRDAGNNLVSGVNVTFTVFPNGASALFSGSTSTTIATNGSGVAIAPTLTANSVAGNFTVSATVSGVPAPANFNLTNTPGPAAGIVATAGTPQSTTINSAYAAALKATVKDASGNLVNGVNVTFAAPTSGASGVFGGPTTVATNSSGVATAPALTANAVVGTFAVKATVAGVATPASFTLSNTAGTPASVTASAGTPQSATINSAFASALKATVKDGAGNLLSGVSVVFAAPASGAGGVFGGPTTVTTNGSGVASAPALTANSIAGNFTVTATVSGVATPANFSLTNNAGSPASIAATAGTPQSTTVGTAFPVALRALVKDASSNPVKGVVVTFAAPGSGASGTFSGSASVTTDSTGTAIAPAFTANAQAGSYSVKATVSGVAGSASFSLTNSSAASNGSLSGSGTSLAANASLTAEGPADWVHWGDGSLTRKAGVPLQISDAALLGTGPIYAYSNDPRPLSWTDGSPLASATNNNGIYVGIVGMGLSFTAPADTTARTLTVHVGGWMSSGTLTAHLSDNSASDFVDTTVTATGQYDRNYTLTYRALNPGQTLKITWQMAPGNGNVTLNGAALAVGP